MLFQLQKTLTACLLLSWAVPGSDIDWSAKLRKCKHKNKRRGNWKETFYCSPTFSQITHLYFCMHFTYRSSLLSESLEQATAFQGSWRGFTNPISQPPFFSKSHKPVSRSHWYANKIPIPFPFCFVFLTQIPVPATKIPFSHCKSQFPFYPFSTLLS